jgi:DNA-directed RNA polymerase specialized sigma24 family protein
MPDAPALDSAAKSRLDQISTRWAAVKDPVQFLMRYGQAIRKYLEALLKNSHDADEVSQDFLLKVLEHGFANADPDRGRFRDYLKRAVRNAALTRLRKQHAVAQPDAILSSLAAENDLRAADAEFLADWRRCLLDRVWRNLESHQRRSPGNLFHTVIRLTVDHPDEDSETLAIRAGEQLGRPLRAEAFRKQLSRARHLFAKLLLAEVTRTLEQPTPELLTEELIELGLFEYVRDFLPPK